MLKGQVTINSDLIKSLGFQQHSINWEYIFYVNDHINIYLYSNEVVVENLGMHYFKLAQVKEFIAYIKKIMSDVKKK